LAGIGGALGLWWLLVFWAAASKPVLIAFAPGPALAAFVQLIAEGTIAQHVLPSLRRVLLGLGLAIILGLPVGLVLGSLRPLDRALTPVFQFLRTISPLSWMPVAVMTLGIGDPSVVFLVMMSAIWPVLLSAASGVRHLNRSWLLLARSVGASPKQILFQVALPAILPQLMTGIRLAVGLAWVVLVPAEMLGVTNGLGYFLLDTRDRLNYSELMATILVIGVLGYLLDLSVRSLEARWRSER